MQRHFAHILRIPGTIIGVLLVCCALALPKHECSAQPKHEVRGVWLTTLLGLDWPASSDRGDIVRQQASLRRIIEDIAHMKLNTVFFQVRSRGNAFYRSAYEPWAAELTGTLGKDPGWDPMEFVLKECHARGLEVHAWINLCKVWQGGGAPPLVKPGHVVRQHPEWVEKYNEEYWLDPGIPGARAYTASVIEDLVRNYDLDGIHLDYVRYPELDFNDARTYAQYGGGMEKKDWRRQNMNALVKLVYDKCTAIRPGLKVGSAPIGIYKSLPTARGWEGYERLAQDSRRWLREGYQDYVVPQIYWGLRGRGSKIDYEALVRDWKANASGRHVYVGTAAYRPEVAKWLHEHIDAARTEGADGQVFFRYAFLKSGDLFGNRYRTKAIPPPMSWRDNTPPPAPVAFNVRAEPNGITLQWKPAAGEQPRRFIVYRSGVSPVDRSIPDHIVAVLPGEARAFTDLYGTTRYHYTVTALDAMNNESAPALPGVPVAEVPDVPEEPAVPQAVPDPVQFASSLAIPQLYGNNLLLIGYNVARPGDVRLRILNDAGEVLYVLVNGHKAAGSYLVGLERNRMDGTASRCELETAGHRITRNIIQ